MQFLSFHALARKKKKFAPHFHFPQRLTPRRKREVEEKEGRKSFFLFPSPSPAERLSQFAS